MRNLSAACPSGNAPAAASMAGAPEEAPSPAATGVVHVVDDDEAVRRSFVQLLGSCGYATATYGSAEEVLAVAEHLAPGCLIVDICMPGMDGLALQSALAAAGVPHPVIVVTGHADVRLAVRAMQAGAIDLIEKPCPAEDILRAVRMALARMERACLQRRTAGHAAALLALLTPREHEVLAQLVEGRANKTIAAALGISPRTVEIHRAHVMEKLGCRSLAAAVRLALAAR